ncbi:MAG: S-layer homology domain-containing protein [Defluviitaleaceae bacterium]|nr:S-layer homology domain-containing protein [Defluviitaleaceae bacterium]
MKKRFKIVALLIAVLMAFGAFAVFAQESNDEADDVSFTKTARFYVMEDADHTETEFSMISEDGELVIHIYDGVPVYFEDYVPKGDEEDAGETRNAREVLFGRTLAEVLEGRNLAVEYAITTRSIPPQTTPISITILFETAVHLPIEIDEPFYGNGYETIEGIDSEYAGFTTLPLEINPFADVQADDWFFMPVVWAYTNNIMNGVSDTSFAPESEMTRAMLVTILWRYAGSPDAGASIFDDVAEDAWYAAAVAWAQENGIVNGISETHFGAADFVNREQMYTILYRYMDFAGLTIYLEEEMRLIAFGDEDEVSEWALEAMMFMFDAGVLFRQDDFDRYARPQQNATRGEIAGAMYFFDMWSAER